MLKTKDKTVGFVEESRGTGHDRMQFFLPLDLAVFSLWFQWCKAAASFFIPKQTAVYRGLLHLEADGKCFGVRSRSRVTGELCL